MSSFTIEAFLYDLAYKGGHMQRFATEPEPLFDEYFMSPEDRHDIRSWDVRGMHERGVSPMLLLLCYTAVFGFEQRGEYLRKMGASDPATATASISAPASTPASAPTAQTA